MLFGSWVLVSHFWIICKTNRTTKDESITYLADHCEWIGFWWTVDMIVLFEVLLVWWLIAGTNYTNQDRELTTPIRHHIIHRHIFSNGFLTFIIQNETTDFLRRWSLNPRSNLTFLWFSISFIHSMKHTIQFNWMNHC